MTAEAMMDLVKSSLVSQAATIGVAANSIGFFRPENEPASTPFIWMIIEPKETSQDSRGRISTITLQVELCCAASSSSVEVELKDSFEIACKAANILSGAADLRIHNPKIKPDASYPGYSVTIYSFNVKVTPNV